MYRNRRVGQVTERNIFLSIKLIVIFLANKKSYIYGAQGQLNITIFHRIYYLKNDCFSLDSRLILIPSSSTTSKGLSPSISSGNQRQLIDWKKHLVHQPVPFLFKDSNKMSSIVIIT